MAAFEQIRQELPDCDAIFFGTDILAVGAMLKARHLDVAIPGDIAIAGYGDLEFSNQLYTPLTTIHVSGYAMGYAAGEMLRKRLQHEEIAQRIVLSPIHIEVRGSTGAL
jgi:LacI family gluconate utilization system Gnt-I transcriptional repressor